MLPVGTRYESPKTGSWIQIIERTPETMTFERLLKPGTGKADPHLHQDFTQTWQAVTGEGEIEVGGERRHFGAGDRIAVDPGTPHRDPYNSGEGEVVVRGSFDPCNKFIEAYAEAWAHCLREGAVNDQDEMPLLQILVIAKETDGRSYRAGVPPALQRLGLPLAAAVGRLRGYRASYAD